MTSFPSSSDPDVPAPPPPTYKLFRPQAVTAATFFGSPIAGATVLAINYQRLGKGAAAGVSVVLGLLATAFAIALAWQLPAKTNGMAIALPILLGMYYLARWLQGPAVERHVQQGGLIDSGWKAFGIGMGFLALIVGGILWYVFLGPGSPGTRVAISPTEEVYFSGQATEADAKTLGASLKEMGFFDGKNEKTVQLRKDDKETVISFVLIKDAWNRADVIDTFRKIGELVAKTMGKPLTVRLMDDAFDVQKTIPIP